MANATLRARPARWTWDDNTVSRDADAIGRAPKRPEGRAKRRQHCDCHRSPCWVHPKGGRREGAENDTNAVKRRTPVGRPFGDRWGRG